MKAPVRKFLLTAQIIFSAGWLGSVAVFITLSIIALNSENMQSIRSDLLVKVKAAAALLVLLVNTTLSVYKPMGLIPFGFDCRRRKIT